MEKKLFQRCETEVDGDTCKASYGVYRGEFLARAGAGAGQDGEGSGEAGHILGV